MLNTEAVQQSGRVRCADGADRWILEGGIRHRGPNQFYHFTPTLVKWFCQLMFHAGIRPCFHTLHTHLHTGVAAAALHPFTRSPSRLIHLSR